MFEIGPRIRSKNADGFIWDLFLCKFAYKIVEMTKSKKVQILYKNVRKTKEK